MALAAAAVYAPTLWNGFAFDDQTVILDAASFLGDRSGLGRLFTSDYFTLSGEATFRPAVTASYVLDWQLGGGKAWVFHLQSVLWHVLASVLVLRLFRRLGAAAWACLAGALIFSVHPALTESVDAIAFREDVMATALGTGALLLFLGPLDGRRRGARAALGGAFLLLALLSKETALAFVLLAPFVWRASGCAVFSRRPEVVAAIVAAVVFGLLRFGVFASPPSYAEFAGGTRWTGLASGLAALVHYVRIALWPHPLCADYRGVVEPVTGAGDLRAWAGAVLLAALLVAAFRARRDRPLAALGVVWFLLGLLPAANLVPIPVFMAERFLYLPMVGAVLVVASLAHELTARIGPGIGSRVAVVFLCVLALGTLRRHAVWKDDLALWRATHEAHPTAYGALHGYATALQEKGSPDEAIPLHLKALEHETMPTYERAAILRSLGTAYGMAGAGGESIEALTESIALEPSAKAHYHLAVTWVRIGRPADAERECRLALAMNPAFPEPHVLLADLVRDRGDADEADRIMRRHELLVGD